jgi:hypothetical protein
LHVVSGSWVCPVLRRQRPTAFIQGPTRYPTSRGFPVSPRSRRKRKGIARSASPSSTVRSTFPTPVSSGQTSQRSATLPQGLMLPAARFCTKDETAETNAGSRSSGQHGRCGSRGQRSPIDRLLQARLPGLAGTGKNGVLDCLRALGGVSHEASETISGRCPPSQRGGREWRGRRERVRLLHLLPEEEGLRCLLGPVRAYRPMLRQRHQQLPVRLAEQSVKCSSPVIFALRR